VYVVLDLRSSPDQPLGDAVETFIRREDGLRNRRAARKTSSWVQYLVRRWNQLRDL